MATWLKDAIFMKYTHRVSTIPMVMESVISTESPQSLTISSLLDATLSG